MSTSDSLKLTTAIAALPGHTDRAWKLSWSPAEPLLASCSSDKSIRLYSYSSPPPSSSSTSAETIIASPTFTHTSTIPTSHSRTVRSLAFSPTGTTLATASFDSTVGIWQRINENGVEDDDAGNTLGGGEWEALDPLEGHESECKSVEWSYDGRLVASCSRDKSVWIWEVIGPAEFECLAVLMDHTQDVKAVSWHPSEELLASVSYDDTLKLYAADPYDDEWTCITTLTPSTAPSTLWTVSFSPCGTYLITSGDSTVLTIFGRDSLVPPGAAALGELGEAVREEGGRMGPWSSGGVRIGYAEKWKWTEKVKIEGLAERSVYSVDWAKGGLSEKEGGIGRVVMGSGDGMIRVIQMTKPSAESPTVPRWELISSIEEAHGVSDINCVSWNRLNPAKAAATLRNLEGGDDPDLDMESDEGASEEERKRGEEKWIGVENIFASAGDDGVIRVWYVAQ